MFSYIHVVHDFFNLMSQDKLLRYIGDSPTHFFPFASHLDLKCNIYTITEV